MIAKLRKVEETVANEPLVLDSSSREAQASMIAEHADSRLLQQQDLYGRRLRNRVIVANAIAWVVIIVVIRLVFF